MLQETLRYEHCFYTCTDQIIIVIIQLTGNYFDVVDNLITVSTEVLQQSQSEAKTTSKYVKYILISFILFYASPKMLNFVIPYILILYRYHISEHAEHFKVLLILFLLIGYLNQ